MHVCTLDNRRMDDGVQMFSFVVQYLALGMASRNVIGRVRPRRDAAIQDEQICTCPHNYGQVPLFQAKHTGGPPTCDLHHIGVSV